jgi:hypothetical protein
MAKKTRVTPIISDKPDLKMMVEMLKMELAHTDAPLATDDEVLQGISKASNKPLSTNTLKTYGRPPKEAAIGRVKFTTAVQPLYVKWLKHQAADTGVTVADVVEKAFAAYKHEKDLNK